MTVGIWKPVEFQENSTGHTFLREESISVRKQSCMCKEQVLEVVWLRNGGLGLSEGKERMDLFKR